MDLASTARARRVSGGRRRSIILPVEASSPIVVNAPDDVSLRGLSMAEKIADLRAKKEALRLYEEKITAESEKWDRLKELHAVSLRKEMEKAQERSHPKEEAEVDLGVRPSFIVAQAREAWNRHMDEDIRKTEKATKDLFAVLVEEDKKHKEAARKNTALAKIYRDGHNQEYLEKRMDACDKLGDKLRKIEADTDEFLKASGLVHIPGQGVVPVHPQ